MIKRYPMESLIGYDVSINIKGTVEDYAMSFLKIFNNIRENKLDMIRVTNYPGSNRVTVTCYEDSLDATKEFLSWFGAILYVDKVLLLKLEEDPEYDYDVYDDIVIVPYID